MSGLQEVYMFLQSDTLNLLNNRHKCQSLCQREFHPQPTLQQASPRKFSLTLQPLQTVLWGFDRAAQWQDTGSHPFSPHFQIKRVYYLLSFYPLYKKFIKFWNTNFTNIRMAQIDT